MENCNGSEYDYRQYDQIWQRVAPHLDPYPEVRQARLEMGGSLTPPGTENLPGAQENPCCMGTDAMESIDVLRGFIEEELADRNYYQAMARKAPTTQASRTLREIGQSEESHARKLMSVHFLITGQCYRPNLVCGRICIPSWCAALRDRYHAETCNGLNYIRAADGTTDPCLTKLLTTMSEEEYRHGERILALLEQSLRQIPTCGM